MFAIVPMTPFLPEDPAQLLKVLRQRRFPADQPDHAAGRIPAHQRAQRRPQLVGGHLLGLGLVGDEASAIAAFKEAAIGDVQLNDVHVGRRSHWLAPSRYLRVENIFFFTSSRIQRASSRSFSVRVQKKGLLLLYLT